MALDTIVVALVVTLAVLFVGRRAYSTMRASKKAKDGCEGCG